MEADNLVKGLTDIVSKGAFSNQKKYKVLPVFRDVEEQKKLALYMTGAIKRSELSDELAKVADGNISCRKYINSASARQTGNNTTGITGGNQN